MENQTWSAGPLHLKIILSKFPNSYFKIARIKTLAASNSVPPKQHLLPETVSRENVQILANMAWFKLLQKKSTTEFSLYLRALRRRRSRKPLRKLQIWFLRSQILASVTNSPEIALDTVLQLIWLYPAFCYCQEGTISWRTETPSLVPKIWPLWEQAFLMNRKSSAQMWLQ